MRKSKKNIYLAALGNAINNDDELDLICKAIGNPDGTESDAYCWIEEGRTEHELVTLLRKIGYDIPSEIRGSKDVKFDSTVQ
jgi:hypothetical protein